MSIIKKCKQCEKEMKVANWQIEKKNFCSKPCQYKHRSENKENYVQLKGKNIPCSYCEKEKYYYPKDIKANKSGKFFCSYDCHNNYRTNIGDFHNNNTSSVNTECVECSKIFQQPQWLFDRGIRRCSIECRNNYVCRLNKEKSKKVKVNCNQCNNELLRIPTLVKHNKYHFCNRDCMTQYYNTHDDFRGENSPNWTGGKENYYGENWREQRREARKRDCFTCQDCGITEDEYGIELSVHHLKLFRLFDNYTEANKLENLISLCEPCHRVRHSGEGHPVKFKDALLQRIKI